MTDAFARLRMPTRTRRVILQALAKPASRIASSSPAATRRRTMRDVACGMDAERILAGGGGNCPRSAQPGRHHEPDARDRVGPHGSAARPAGATPGLAAGEIC